MVMTSSVQALPHNGVSSSMTPFASTVPSFSSSASPERDDSINNNIIHNHRIINNNHHQNGSNIIRTNSYHSSPSTTMPSASSSGLVEPPSPSSFDARQLQSPSTHEALLRLHDNEIVLLESVKKFATQKSNCDKEYAKKVLDICGQVRKAMCSIESSAGSNNNNNSTSQTCSSSLPFVNAWNVFLRETERAAELTKANADVISNKLVETFGAIVGEKKFSKKKYVDGKSSLESEVEKAVALVHQQHAEYVKHVAKNKVAREKFEELFRKNKTGSAKFADAKAKFRKSSTRLHNIHNNYILALEDAKWWQQHRKQRLAPALLQLHHAGQVNLAAQTKDSLAQLRELGDSTAEAFNEGQRRIFEEIEKFEAEDAYKAFGQEHMVETDHSSVVNVTESSLLFDNALLRDYQGTLAEGRVVVDDLTIDDLRIKLNYFVDRQRHFAAQIEKKESAISSLEAASVENHQGGRNESTTPVVPSDLNTANVDNECGEEEEEEDVVPTNWRQARRPTANSLENLLRESNKSLSSSDNVDTLSSDALNGNTVVNFNLEGAVVNTGNESPSSRNSVHQQNPPVSPSLLQQRQQQPRATSICSASMRPLSGTSLILEGGNAESGNIIGESTTETGIGTESSRTSSLRKGSLPTSSTSGLLQRQQTSPRQNQQQPQLYQRQSSINSPISSDDTITPNSPSKKSVVSIGSLSSGVSSPGGANGSPSRGVVTADGAFVISNSLAVGGAPDVETGVFAPRAITDQAPVHRGKGGESEIHLGVIRHMRQELEKLLCDKERCEAKLELVKSALDAIKGEEGDIEVPTAIPPDGGSINADNSTGSADGNAPLTPLAATTVRSSPFKKNHNNRLTKIFRRGPAEDPAPPPPPDYPGNDVDGGGHSGSLTSSETSSSIVGGGGGSSASTGVLSGAGDNGNITPSYNPTERRASVEPPHSPSATGGGSCGLPRQMESYMDLDNAASGTGVVNLLKLRDRTGSLTPSMTTASNLGGAGNPLAPVGEYSASSENISGAGTQQQSTPTTGGAPSVGGGRRNSRTPSATGGGGGGGASNSTSRHSISLDAATLEEEEWFHGILPRDEVVRLLSENGDFLVRETTKNGKKNIVLSVAWNGHKHFMVQKTAEGKFRFEGSAFPSVSELIRNQWEAGSPVTVKSGAVLQRQIPRMDWEIRNDDIVCRERIGTGNFGEVYKGILNTTGQDVAIKTCKINLPEDQKKKFLQEGSILKQYNHPNIVKLIGIAAQRQPIMIVMELVDGGSLLTFLRRHGGRESQKTLVRMCADASAGMEYLESVKCIHRDLAARNCLVGSGASLPLASAEAESSTPAGNKIVKISDFGMSRENEIYECSDGMKQIPIKWTAPEALNWGRYTSLCDVWSFGILMWEIFSHGSTPYPGWANPRAREEVERGYRMPAPEGTPEKMYGLMRRCWEYEQENRPHFSEIHAEIKAIYESMT